MSDPTAFSDNTPLLVSQQTLRALVGTLPRSAPDARPAAWAAAAQGGVESLDALGPRDPFEALLAVQVVAASVVPASVAAADACRLAFAPDASAAEARRQRASAVSLGRWTGVLHWLLTRRQQQPEAGYCECAQRSHAPRRLAHGAGSVRRVPIWGRWLARRPCHDGEGRRCVGPVWANAATIHAPRGIALGGGSEGRERKWADSRLGGPAMTARAGAALPGWRYLAHRNPAAWVGWREPSPSPLRVSTTPAKCGRGEGAGIDPFGARASRSIRGAAQPSPW
jgi:hypothetical protein